MGAIGFGKMAVLHLAAFEGQQFENVAGDHPLLLMLADIAARDDVVIYCNRERCLMYSPGRDQMHTSNLLDQII